MAANNNINIIIINGYGNNTSSNNINHLHFIDHVMSCGACLKSLMLCVPFGTAAIRKLNQTFFERSTVNRFTLQRILNSFLLSFVPCFDWITFYFIFFSLSVSFLCASGFHSFICKICQKQLPWWVFLAI